MAVVDLRLPGIDGPEVLSRIGEASPATAVIMMTAHSSVTSAVEAMRRGAFDYLTKPLALEELRMGTIGTQSGPGDAASPDPLTRGLEPVFLHPIPKGVL